MAFNIHIVVFGLDSSVGMVTRLRYEWSKNLIGTIVRYPVKARKFICSTNFEVDRDVHPDSSYSLGDHFSSPEGKEAEDEAHLSP